MKKVIPLFLSILFLGSCAEKDLDADTTKWRGPMHKVAGSYGNLLFLSDNKKTFAKPESLKKARLNLGSMKSSMKDLHKSDHKSSSDPLLSHNVGALLEDLEMAEESLEEDRNELSRLIINRTSSYCISCHTRTANGRTDLRLARDFITKGIGPGAQVSYLFALRQYTKGLKIAERLLANGKNPLANFQGLIDAVNITVRVERDPDKTLDLLQSFVGNKNIRRQDRRLVKYWIKNAKTWTKKTHFDRKSPSMASVSQLLKSAERAPSASHAYINLLIASESMHNILKTSKQRDQNYYESLYYLGMAYEYMARVYPNTLYEAYYVRCIHELPNSDLAMSCFRKLKITMTSGSYVFYSDKKKAEIDNRLWKLKWASKRDKSEDLLNFGDRFLKLNEFRGQKGDD